MGRARTEGRDRLLPSDRVLFTRRGGGAFGNAEEWIDDAMTRALRIAAGFCIDVTMVSYGLAPLRSLWPVTACLSIGSQNVGLPIGGK